ncbi:MAG: hypothetical protein ABIF88_00820, partial [archaeon]
TIASCDIGDIIIGDTTIAINAAITAGNMKLNFTDGGAGQDFTLDIGGSATLGNITGDLKWFGNVTQATDKEIAVSTDMLVDTTSVGTYDYDIMTTNGQIIKTPKAGLEDDKITFSVPSDRVYGMASVLVGGSATSSAGILSVLDTGVASVAGKNLIVVGGSAINSVAAELLGGAYSGAAFTTATGVGAGEFLIQSFSRAGKTALLVAGYNAEDTTKAGTYLLNNAVTTDVGTKYKGTSATSATLIVA